MSHDVARRVCMGMLTLAFLGLVYVLLPRDWAGWSPSTERFAGTVSLLIGVALPQLTFALVQSQPGGRPLLPIAPGQDGWLWLMVVTFIECIASVSAGRDSVSSLPYVALGLVSVVLAGGRSRQLRRDAKAL